MITPAGPPRLNVAVSPAVHRRLTEIRHHMARSLERDVKYNQVIEALLEEHDARQDPPAEGEVKP